MTKTLSQTAACVATALEFSFINKASHVKGRYTYSTARSQCKNIFAVRPVGGTRGPWGGGSPSSGAQAAFGATWNEERLGMCMGAQLYACPPPAFSVKVTFLHDFEFADSDQ